LVAGKGKPGTFDFRIMGTPFDTEIFGTVPTVSPFQ